MNSNEHPAAAASEASAVRVTLEGNHVQRLAAAARALVRLAQDPNDTEQVFILGVTLNARALPRLISRFVSEPNGLELMSERPAIDKRAVDFDKLRALPEDTLGGAYVRFLDRNGLDPDLFQAPPGLPVAIAFLAQRLRQTHDLWHVVAGFETGVGDEVALQAFTFGQLGMPSSAAIALMGMVRFGWRQPKMLPAAVSAYQRGKQAAFLATVRWEEMWEMPLAEVRRSLGVVTAAPARA